MNAWYLLYLVACIINTYLLNNYADLGLSDTVFWIWFSVPILAYAAGREWKE